MPTAGRALRRRIVRGATALRVELAVVRGAQTHGSPSVHTSITLRIFCFYRRGALHPRPPTMIAVPETVNEITRSRSCVRYENYLRPLMGGSAWEYRGATASMIAVGDLRQPRRRWQSGSSSAISRRHCTCSLDRAQGSAQVAPQQSIRRQPGAATRVLPAPVANATMPLLLFLRQDSKTAT